MTNPIDTQPIQLSIQAAASKLGLSVATLYRMENDHEIELVRIRRRTFVPMSEIERISTPKREPVGVPVGEPKKRRPKKRVLIPKASPSP